MNQELPTPDDIQQDLHRIVHNLDQFWNLRLDSLAALPTVRAWQPYSSTIVVESEAERRAYAIEDLIVDVIPQQPYKEDRDSLAALFTFGDTARTISDRHKNAGVARGQNSKGDEVSGDSFRVTYESKVLERLAIDIYRTQLGWCMQQIDLGRSSVQTVSQATWWSFVEIDWSVTIAEDDPSTEIWEFRSLLRCDTAIAQPIVSITMKWTGHQGPMDTSEIEVLSGPKDSNDANFEFPHQLLNVRPASPSPVADTAYIWDLGSPLLAGDEVELAWRNPMHDRTKTGRPFIGVSTAYKPDLRAIRLRARIPPGIAEQPRAEEHAEHHMLTSGYAAPWVKLLQTEPLQPDDDGYYTYKPELVTRGRRYELWWGMRPSNGNE
jgi:hypothetical protein